MVVGDEDCCALPGVWLHVLLSVCAVDPLELPPLNDALSSTLQDDGIDPSPLIRTTSGCAAMLRAFRATAAQVK